MGFSCRLSLKSIHRGDDKGTGGRGPTAFRLAKVEHLAKTANLPAFHCAMRTQYVCKPSKGASKWQNSNVIQSHVCIFFQDPL